MRHIIINRFTEADLMASEYGNKLCDNSFVPVLLTMTPDYAISINTDYVGDIESNVNEIIVEIGD